MKIKVAMGHVGLHGPPARQIQSSKTYSKQCDQVCQLTVRWKTYGQLFDSGPANAELLNGSGFYVFWLTTYSRQPIAVGEPRSLCCRTRALDDFDLEARKRLGESHLKDSKSFFKKGNIPNRARL